MAPTPLRLDGLLVKVETTYAADPTPVTNVDGVRLSDRFWSSMRITHRMTNLRDEALTGTLTPLAPGAPRGRVVELEVGWEVKGAGVAYATATKVEAQALLRSCALSENLTTTASAEAYTYTHSDATHESCTVWAYAAGNVYKVNGCRGSLRWQLGAGQLSLMRFSLQGLLSTAPAAAAIPTSPNYSTVVPPPAAGVALTVGSWSPDMYAWAFDQRAELHFLDSGNATDGVQGIHIARVRPLVTLSSPTVAEATYNPYSDARTPTSRAIAYTVGSSQYNRAALSVGAAYVGDPRHTDYEDMTAWELEYLCTGSSPFSIRFH